MNDRERLIELFYRLENRLALANKVTGGAAIKYDEVADFFIANGVTVQKHGRWEDYVNIKGVVRCSECNDTYIYREWVDEGKWHYCPNCGAKMSGGEDAE